ncbi:MAG: crosslink repair DNA glycosylase YcaQ family protein [Pseudomonadota bacterium]
MAPTLPRLSNEDARRLFLDGHGLLERPKGPARRSDIAAQVAALGFVQVDSVNVLARAHDHILWSRLPAYRQGGAMACSARDRSLFEGWTHDAALLPVAQFAHWRHKFEADRAALIARWETWGRAGFHKEFDQVRARIAREGALTAAELGGERQTSGGWWDWKPTKTALEYLWRSGELGICHRRGFTKVYDLTERLIPPEHLNSRKSAEETLEWSARAALARLGFGTPSELSAFWDIFPKRHLAEWAAQTPKGLARILVEHRDGTVREALIEEDWEVKRASLGRPSNRIRILSPFDPALRDRKRLERLFGFSYRIEIFVPEAKRRYGYYVFPILEGTRLIGRIEVKADRERDRLRVLGYWPEPGITLGTGRAARLGDELIRLARFANVSDIEVARAPKTAILRDAPGF